MVTVMNRNPTLSEQDIVRILSSEFGDVYSIYTPPDNSAKRYIEFCDVRHATAAKQVLEGIAAKIPTISEVGFFTDAALLTNDLFPPCGMDAAWG
jgi:hypothetical protein